MAAFDTNLVAITWRAGKYDVISQTIARIDCSALEREGLLHDVSEDVGYIDDAAIVQVKDFAKYLLPESNPWHREAREWYLSLPRQTMFILVHRAEYETGLGD